MDADFGTTSSGKLCKKCVHKGSRCSQHGGSLSPIKSPKCSPKSPKRRSPNVFTNLPCGVLLKIANELDPEDYLKMTNVSYEIDLCLSEGRYKTKKEKGELKAAQKKILKQIDNVETLSYNIQYIDNPSEIVQLAAVRHNADSFRFIKNPTEKVQLHAVRTYADQIRFIENPSEKVQLAAVNKWHAAIQYIKNPTEAVKKVVGK